MAGSSEDRVFLGRLAGKTAAQTGAGRRAWQERGWGASSRWSLLTALLREHLPMARFIHLHHGTQGFAVCSELYNHHYRHFLQAQCLGSGNIFSAHERRSSLFSLCCSQLHCSLPAAPLPANPRLLSVSVASQCGQCHGRRLCAGALVCLLLRRVGTVARVGVCGLCLLGCVPWAMCVRVLAGTVIR